MINGGISNKNYLLWKSGTKCFHLVFADPMVIGGCYALQLLLFKEISWLGSDKSAKEGRIIISL